MKDWYKYLVYLSLLCVAMVLYRADYLRIPRLFSPPSFWISVFFLLTGFVLHVFSWQKTLEVSNQQVSLRRCTASVGLSIFAKYIPGKIWMVMGRAVYLSSKNANSLASLTVASIKAQCITILVGLLLGCLGLFHHREYHHWAWVILGLAALLSFLLFNPMMHRLGQQLLMRFFRRSFNIPQLNLGSTLKIIPWFIAYWLAWSTGFYFLAKSLTPQVLPWFLGLNFPLAATVGILTFLAPGGLGTREAVLVFFLLSSGVPLAEATSISITSRLWFLLGEGLIFLLGYVAHRRAMGWSKCLGKEH
jgi:uncharacterized membrane protein YbhN (UPF0104 family)